MSGRRRRIAIIAGLALLPVALVLAAEVIVRQVALGQIRSMVENDLQQSLGLAVAVDAMHLEVLPRPQLEAQGIRIGEPGDGLRAAIGRVELAIEIGPLRRREIVIDSIDIADVELHLDLPEEVDAAALAGSIDALAGPDETAATASQSWFDIDARHLSARAVRATVAFADGRASHSLDLARLELGRVDRDGPVVARAIGALDGAPFDLRARGGPIALLLAPTAPYPLEVAGSVSGTEIEARGSVREPLGLSGVELSLRVRVPDLSVTGWPLAELGAISLAGELSDADGSLGLEHLEVRTVAREPVDASIEGRVDEIGSLRDIELSAHAQAPRTGFLRAWLPFVVPDDVSAKADATLSSASGKLVGELHLDARTPGGSVSIDLRGRFGDPFGDPFGGEDMDLQVEARADDIASLAALHPSAPSLPDIGAIGPVRASGRLRQRDGRLSLEAIDAVVSDPKAAPPWAEVKGEIDDLMAGKGLSLATRFAVRSAERFGEAIGRRLPPLGAFEGRARLTDRDGSLGLEEIHLSTLDGGPVALTLSATLDDLRKRDEITAQVELRSRDLSTLGALLEREWPPLGPFSLAARLTGSAESLVAKNARIVLGKTEMAGEFAARFVEGERPFLRAHVQSPRARVDDFVAPRTEERTARRKPMHRLLPFADLRAVDLDVGIRFDRFVGAFGRVQDFHAALWLEDGLLVLSDVAARYRRGQVEGWARIDARQPVPETSLRLDATGIDLEKILAQLDGKAEATGLADLHLDLTSRGVTPEQLLLGLGGRARAVARDGTAVSQYSQRFVVNLATTAFPFLQLRRAPRIGCAVADFTIEEGIATAEELFLEEGDIEIVGGGTVDLPAGRYDLHFVPRARTQGLLSVTPEVAVTGPLEAPEFEPVTRTVISSLARGLVSNAERAAKRLLNPFRRGQDADLTAAEACAQVGTPLENGNGEPAEDDPP